MNTSQEEQKQSLEETDINEKINLNKLKVRMVIKNKDLNMEQKKKKLSDIVIKSLQEVGIFYKTKNLVFYFFDKSQKKIFKIKEQEFKFLLNQYFEVNGSTDYYKYLIEELSSYIAKNAEEVKIYDFSYYDIDSNTLYIYNNGVKIIKITSDKVEEMENGYNGIIFETKSSSEEWNLVRTIDQSTSFQRVKEIIERVSYDVDSHVRKEDYMWMLENYIYALFFPNILNTRPILAFIGNKGSGKSFFLKLLLYIFYGKEASLSNLPSNDEEFKNSLMNNYLYFIDNLDDSISKTKIDILCSVATGIGIKKRVLYTDMTELNFKVNSFLAITSRTPKFKRVDLNERLLIIKLQSLENYISETELFKRINRDEMMTCIVLNLRRLLKNIGKYQYHQTKFRIADFANLLLNLGIDNRNDEEIQQILESFTREQEEFSLETDPLIELLERIVNDRENVGKTLYFTAQKLHQALIEESNYTFRINGERVPYSIKSAIGLGKKLSEIQKGLAHRFNFKIEKGSSNIKNYIFGSQKTEDSPNA